MDLGTNQVESGNDLAAVMRLALNEERKNRDQLLGELTRTRESVGKQQALLTQREQQVQIFQEQLQAREQENQKLQEEQANLQQQQGPINIQINARGTRVVCGRPSLDSGAWNPSPSQ